MGKEHCNEDHKRLQLASYQVRAVTYLSGSVKNHFINDCIKRGGNNSNLLRDIVALHYAIIDKINIGNSPEFEDVLKRIK